MTIVTDRLVIEPLTITHAPAYLAYLTRNRAHLEPWEPARQPEFYTLAYHMAAIAAHELDPLAGTSARFVGFARDGRDDVVTNVNLWMITRGVGHHATIGYSVDASAQGAGIATEAVGAVVRYAFETLGLHRVQTSYQPTNERSGRVLRKLGFVVEGYARDYLLVAGAWRDGILVSRTNPEWRPASR